MSRARDELGFANAYTPQTAMADYLAWLAEGNEK